MTDLEDAQPNDLRGRNVQGVAIRPASLKSRRPPFKRPSDRAYTFESPSKRRRLDQPSRKEVIRELPLNCRKGEVGCNKERKCFIAKEIELLQNSEHGLKVSTYRLTNDAVHFTCLQVDILNCSLAPSSFPLNPNNGMQPKDPIQPKVDPQSPSPPNPYVAVVTGPPRIFKSGTLSFKPAVPVTGEAYRERAVAPRAVSGNFDADLDHLVPVAELLFGKQGPPRPMKHSLDLAETISTARIVKPLSMQSGTPSAVASSIQPPSLSTTSCQTAGQVPSPDFSAVKPLSLQSQTQAVTASSILPYQTAAQSSDFFASTSADNVIPPAPTASISTGDHIFEADGDEFRIPFRHQHDKLRRYLTDPSHSSSAIISMYGALEGVDILDRKHWLIAQGPNPTREAVEDACLVTDGIRSVAILGHGRDRHQLSLINMDEMNVEKPPVTDLKRPWNPTRKGGVTAVAPMMQPSTFATGGYDHMVHLWTIQVDLSSALSVPLNIKHNSQVQSLLSIRDSSHKLISAGADCSVNIWDLSSERVAHSVKTSNSVYHLHPTVSPFCTLLEVAHRELQFEVRDHRCVPTIAVQRFGYTTPQVHGRFMKGSALANCFASGDRVGHVRLWDLRNVKHPHAEVKCFDGQKIAHLMFQSSPSRLLAFSETNQIRVIKYNQRL